MAQEEQDQQGLNAITKQRQLQEKPSLRAGLSPSAQPCLLERKVPADMHM